MALLRNSVELNQDLRSEKLRPLPLVALYLNLITKQSTGSNTTNHLLTAVIWSFELIERR